MSIKLLSNLDFAAKLNATNAITESGMEFLKNYRGYMYQNAASCGIVNGFVNESNNYKYDAGVMAIRDSVLNFINENNISWKLASACESVLNNNSSYNYIAKIGVSQVEKLLEMNESEVVQYIKGGCLKNVQYIPEFRNVCKEVFQSTITEVHKNTYNINTPYSYVVIDEGVQYFNVLGKTYKIDEGKVSETTYNDAIFNRVNSLLPNFKLIDDDLVYEYKANYNAEPFKFVVSEECISLYKGNRLLESFASTTKFKQFADTYAKQLFLNEKFTFVNTCNSISEIFECIDNIVMVDCANVMECADSTVLAIVEADNNVILNIAKSPRFGQCTKQYDYMLEALHQVEKVTGNNIQKLYESRVNEDMKVFDPVSYTMIKESVSEVKDDQMEYRKKKIAMLAEQFKNDPVKIALLNNLAKELAVLENK